MIQNYHPSKNPVMKHSTVLLLLVITSIILAILGLPWYTQVVVANDYFFSVSKTGVETAASLPVVIPLALTMIVVFFKRSDKLGLLRRRMLLGTGILIALYAIYFYCGKALTIDSSPGLGVLLAIFGGIALIMFCVFQNDEQ